LFHFSVRITPPLCSCGRRSKRLVVSKPGPNQGRTFFACSLKKSEACRLNSGCGFFKWETTDQGQSPKFSNSKSFVTNSTSKTFDKPSSKSFASFANQQNVETVSCLPSSSFLPKLPVSKTVSSMLLNENNENQKTVSDIVSKSGEAKQNVDRNHRTNPPISKSLTSFSSKRNTTTTTTVTSKSLTSLPSVEHSRPTLGSARRSSNVGLFSTSRNDNVTTPEMKRARLNFNAPAFSSGKRSTAGLQTGCVVQQYFGNVPFNSL
jgi:hypothetical protein